MKPKIELKKMLEHISHYKQPNPGDYDGPYELTVYGMSEKFGLSRQRITVAVRILERNGLVVNCGLFHVPGRKMRVSVYGITNFGRECAEARE